MEITATIGSMNAGISRNVTDTSEQQETRPNAFGPNAFGIGEANRTEIELSPQARILQQTDANQRELRERLEQQRQDTRDSAEQAREDEASRETNGNKDLGGNITSEGSTQRNSLSSERAVGVYQAIAERV